ncbi:MAG: MFS transporter [Clostridia bacterium]|nr:MFS transporter [Clostridia bacterium]
MAMQAGFWAMFAAICAFQAALLYGRGFSSGDVGLTIAVRCLAGIVLQPLLGSFADKHPNIPLKLITGASMAVSLVAGIVFLRFPMGLPGTLVIFFVIGGFEVSAYPLMDAMAIQYINAGMNIRYSLGRGVGSLAYAFCCILLGLQAARWGMESILITHAALVALEILLILTFPTFRAAACVHTGTERPRPQSTLSLLRTNPSFTLMLFALLLSITSVIPMSNFLLDILLSKGGTTASLSVGLFLMAGSEILTTIFFQRFLNRMGSGKLLLMSMVFMTLKAGALLLAPSVGWIYLFQPLQMLGYGLFTPASVFYVNESVPEADRVKGQTLMMVATNGLGGVLGSLLPGYILDLGNAHGGRGVIWMLASSLILGALAVVLAIPAIRKKRAS